MESRLRKIRKAKKISLEETAKFCGVSKQSIGHWETGERNPSPVHLKQLSELFQVPQSYFLDPDYTETLNTTDIRQITKELLYTLHGKPIWDADKEKWYLINTAKKCLISETGAEIPFDDLNSTLQTSSPAFYEPQHRSQSPIAKKDLKKHREIYVEPIGTDIRLRTELSGIYKYNSILKCAERDEVRFSEETYGIKWLAFQSDEE